MERPTIISSGPDAMGRTVYHGDELARRARYGRIHPMHSRAGTYPRSLIRRLTAWL